MVVAINPARNEPQRQTAPKEDGLTRDLKRIQMALGIAESGFGIMTGFDERAKLDQQTEESAKRTAAMASPKEAQAKRAADVAKTEAETAGIGQTKSFDLAKEERAIVKHDSELSRKKYQNEREMRQDVQRDPRRLANNKRTEFINIVKATHEKFINDPSSISPLDQATMIESYKKAIDPGSAVMGGEFDTIRQQTIGWIDSILAKKDRITGGVILTETQMKQLFNNVSLIDQVNSKNVELMNNFWTKNATANGILPERVLDVMQIKDPIAEMNVGSEGGQTKVPITQKLSDKQLDQMFDNMMKGVK